MAVSILSQPKSKKSDDKFWSTLDEQTKILGQDHAKLAKREKKDLSAAQTVYV